MTRRTMRLTLELEGPLLVGGYTSAASDVDATTAKAGDRFLVPASTLRGALREACMRLENARLGSDAGFAPGELTCELFGAPGPDRPNLTEGTEQALHEGDGQRGRLRVTDATSHGEALHDTVRHGVGIDRHTGSAYPEHHFQREVAGAPGQRLEATLVCDASDEAMALLEDAVALVTGVGNSQSRGLGHVRVSLEPAGPDPEERSVTVAAAARDTALVVDVRALDPLLVGGLPTATNVRETLPYLPGSALRGALADAALRSGVTDDDPAFQHALVDPATCLLFSDALPSAGDREVPLPAPRSRLACKHDDDHRHEGKARVARDTLITGALAEWVLARGGRLDPFTCAVCDRTLTTARGWVPRVAQARRVVTRLARDVATGSVAPGLLYSTVQIEKGARFRGTVARVDDVARSLLARIDADVRVGGLRNRGLGNVHLTLEASNELGEAAVRHRRKRMSEVAKPLVAAAERLGARDLAGAQLLAVVARTDLAVPPDAAPQRVGDAVFGGAAHRVMAVAQAADVRSGWCDRSGAPRPLRPVVAAGSAWLFTYEGDGPTDAHLARLEVEGVGDHRELGLGRLAIAPRALMEGWE